jgi:uncharacterized protein YprB with RNaseH-like and TPR domain/predicted nuclease with RNAse H fold/dephospho-CoA kinase
MLSHTFIHLPGIGPKKERSLWEQGILTWDDFERHFLAQRSLFPNASDDALLRTIEESRIALDRGEFDFFADRLPRQEHYRIALTEPQSTVFVDIETTGLSLYYDYTTLIGAADLNRYYVYTRGQPAEWVAEVINHAKCIVTFNGTAFDLKFLRKEFPEIRAPRSHVDLRFFGIPFGLRGSQKHIESELGLKRPEEIQGMRGEKAPLLWYQYTRGDLQSGKQLIEYNHSDIEGMKFIFDAVMDRMLGEDVLLAKMGRRVNFYRGNGELRWASEGESRDSNRISLPRFRGHIGPQITYASLAHDARAAGLRVVGIDLTGSEKRPTGWCSLAGRVATTKLVRSDKDIIAETVAAKPDVVSIDSPLSLPRGRKRVSDDDPGRDKYGIMRECERTLKKRGVNVYPSLINSMQQLTARGIRLAKELRSLGIPVIESYPGAAQDIMGIPRKRAGLEYLKDGLGAFGISGDFLSTKVSHDEVDAVTAAVVGLFFWAGKFEALGNDDEEYLIIPDLVVPPDPWRNRLVVGISGPIAAGKTTAARFLARKGFVYGRYSEVLARLLSEKGKKVDRQTLQAFGEKVHKKPGQRWLSRQLVKSLPGDRDLVIDGLRFPEDHAFLVESFGPAFFHIHVTAPEEVRKERYVADGNTGAEFARAIRHPVEAKIPRLAAIAQAEIANERSQRAFDGRIESAVEAAKSARLSKVAEIL